ncbi:MAG TPA: family 43 glycosylhydrolase, partial [Cellvibrionaceae bacterium]
MRLAMATLAALMLAACTAHPGPEQQQRFASAPLITHQYSADPAVHNWDGVLYIYNSHDIENHEPHDAAGSHFVMRDYPVYSMDAVDGEVTDHGIALALEDIPWAHRQLWAPDAARHKGNYYLYFPAKDAEGVFRIGVAKSNSPTGPFTAEPTPIAGTFSVDPAVFADNGEHYLLWGGTGGGQLQRWNQGQYTGVDHYPANNEPALTPRISRLTENKLNLAEAPQALVITDAQGKPLQAGDRHRRFAEGVWLHKYQGTYYLS